MRIRVGAIVQWMQSVIEQQPAMAGGLHMPWFVDCWNRGVDTVLRGAPHLVVAHGPESDEIARMACLMTL
ncbi:MAG: hypothetical protein JW940_26630, partial [Polyangiaceae bacterium]|nr:hypothetical protein [Polyangiaceae bacterium]